MTSIRKRLLASLRPSTDDSGLVEQAPSMSLAEVLKRFWPRLKPLRGWIVVGLLLLAAAPAIEVVEILLFQQLVDDVLVPADFSPLLWLALAYIGLNILSAVISGCDDYLSTWISQRFLVQLRTDVFAHVLSLPLYGKARRRLGDVMSRITSDTAAVENFIIGHLTDGIGALIRLVIFVTALFWLQWELALASMIVVPLFWWISTRFARFIREVSRERRRRGGSLSAVAEESLSNAPLVQAYNREKDAVAKYHRENTAIASSSLAASRIRSVFLPMVDLAELAGMLAVVALGTWALATDRLTLGGLLAFLTLMAQCYSPIRHLGDLIPALYSASAGVERVVELLDEKPPAEKPGAITLNQVRGDIELRNVSVRYPGTTKDALSRADLQLRAGEVVALVGPSGAGKSTVVRLLTRHIDPTSGTVCLDGHDVQDLTLANVRESVTVVLQEALLLDASVRDNIAFARPDASTDEIEEAARQADAHSFIAALPAGYQTRIGQRGRSLSGGQLQRLAVARALLRDTPVLVLDEPTTGLDAASARRVLEPLMKAACGRTILIVTHDPVAMEMADRIVEVHDGRVAPAGAAAATMTMAEETAR